jgi:hypothetical protein
MDHIHHHASNKNRTIEKISTKTKNYCSDNLLATWPLVKLLGTIQEGRDLIQQSFRLCQPLLYL